MKFVRYGTLGQERPGIVDSQGNIRDISAYVPDIYPGMLFEKSIVALIQKLNVSDLPLIDAQTRLGACVASVGKIICIGFNSSLHAQELGVDCAKRSEPIVFMKPTSALAGPNDPVMYTRHTKKLDWEAELAIVIGKKGKYIPIEEAEQYIFGYACFNDLSERYLQLETEDKQFTKGKCFDGSAVLGPYLVSKTEITHPDDLHVKLWVNDVLRQDFNTKEYRYHQAYIVSFLSQYFTLYPGDVISMGSGPGSARSWGEDCFLRPGDQMILQIEGLGIQRNNVILESSPS